MARVVHFVRFGKFDQHYWNAVSVFGRPAFLHQRWDLRAQREIAPNDVVVFAEGDPDQQVVEHNGDDEFYECN